MDSFERKARRAVIDRAASSLAHAIRAGDAEAIELTQALLPEARRRPPAPGDAGHKPSGSGARRRRVGGGGAPADTVGECSSASSRT